MKDKSNGYDSIAALYSQQRGATGSATVRAWAQSFAEGAVILDLGCGTGIPVTKILLEAGLQVYAVDASAKMVAAFQDNFPDVPVECESVEQSQFFNRTYDGIISIGVMFLLPETSQRSAIAKMAAALHPGGKLLFTAPLQKVAWQDVMTAQTSRSLGAEEYKKLMQDAGLSIGAEFEDEGGNHYFSGIK
ncbi:class I SAM-dependent methyltransferase [Chitinophaga sp.]|uniref:class I SAM-dependent methyltransferase n=1 Tax=Chitinophaga sp. TaxID=1869181 RepID=UPI0031DE3394